MGYDVPIGGDRMRGVTWSLVCSLVVLLPLWALLLYVVSLVIRALRKYIKSGPTRKEAQVVRTTLGEKLREHRMGCQMSQEFVAEAVGVTRQAVSKWENGVSDPSTSNLLALAKLYGLSAEELLKGL